MQQEVAGIEASLEDGSADLQENAEGDKGAVELPLLLFSRDSTLIEASSVLEDATGYGFAYDANNVFDVDYSTSWCSSSKDEEPTLTIIFSQPTELGHLGIMPGFARDKTIFNQNNRIKTIEFYLNDEEVAFGQWDFDDEYEMQFYTMPHEEISQLTLKIKEVYPGSKYDDTCIAEIDFWSDWVTSQDSEAAYNYYEEYKKDLALRPVGIDNIFLFNAGKNYNVCSIGSSEAFVTEDWGDSVVYFLPSREGYPRTYKTVDGGTVTDTGFYFSYSKSENRYDFPCCRDIFFSLKMNQWTELGDEISSKWYLTNYSFEDRSTTTKLLGIDTSVVQGCGDGLFAFGPLGIPNDYPLGNYVVEFYFQDHLIGEAFYNMSQ